MERKKIEMKDLIEAWEQDGGKAHAAKPLSEADVRRIITSPAGVRAVAAIRRRRAGMAVGVVALFAVFGAALFVSRSPFSGSDAGGAAPLVAQSRLDTFVAADGGAVVTSQGGNDGLAVASGPARPRHGARPQSAMPTVPSCDTLAVGVKAVGDDTVQPLFFTDSFESMMCNNQCDTNEVIKSIDRLIQGDNA